MSVYSELLELLRPDCPTQSPVIFGKLSGLSPLSVTVGEEKLSEGLLRLASLQLDKTDLGREAALLPCQEGFLILGITEGGVA